MKTLKRLDLEEMARTMPLIPIERMSSIVGAYDPYDCVWHCLAYAESGGTNYNDQAAYKMAERYYGGSFDSNNYAYQGDAHNIRAFASGMSSSYSGNLKILVETSGSVGHAIILKNYSNGEYDYVDPQSGAQGKMSVHEVNSKVGYFINF